MKISPEIMSSQVPRGSCTLKAVTPSAQCGRVGGVSGGVLHHGASEEDGPVTWEIRAVPRKTTGDRGEPEIRPPPGRAHAGARRSGQRTSTSSTVGRSRGRPEMRPTIARKSEGCIRANPPRKGWSRRAMTWGNGWHPDPAEQRRPVLCENFRRDRWLLRNRRQIYSQRNC